MILETSGLYRQIFIVEYINGGAFGHIQEFVLLNKVMQKAFRYIQKFVSLNSRLAQN